MATMRMWSQPILISTSHQYLFEVFTCFFQFWVTGFGFMISLALRFSAPRIDAFSSSYSLMVFFWEVEKVVLAEYGWCFSYNYFSFWRTCVWTTMMLWALVCWVLCYGCVWAFHLTGLWASGFKIAGAAPCKEVSLKSLQWLGCTYSDGPIVFVRLSVGCL